MLTGQALLWAVTVPRLGMAQRALQVHAAACQQGAAQCMNAIAQRQSCYSSDMRAECMQIPVCSATLLRSFGKLLTWPRQ